MWFVVNCLLDVLRCCVALFVGFVCFTSGAGRNLLRGACVWCMSCIACCALFALCCWLFGLFGVGVLLFVRRCVLRVACCQVFDVRCMLYVGILLLPNRVGTACSLLVVVACCLLRAAWCELYDLRCLLFVVCYM